MPPRPHRPETALRPLVAPQPADHRPKPAVSADQPDPQVTAAAPPVSPAAISRPAKLGQETSPSRLSARAGRGHRRSPVAVSGMSQAAPPPSMARPPGRGSAGRASEPPALLSQQPGVQPRHLAWCGRQRRRSLRCPAQIPAHAPCPQLQGTRAEPRRRRGSRWRRLRSRQTSLGRRDAQCWPQAPPRAMQYAAGPARSTPSETRRPGSRPPPRKSATTLCWASFGWKRSGRRSRRPAPGRRQRSRSDRKEAAR